jgi:ABC-type uncharacterized transport system permease subunit
MLKIFGFLQLLLYLVTFIAYLADIKPEKGILFGIKRTLLFVTLFSHLLFLFYIFSSFKHFPITDKTELFTVVAFGVAFIYFLLELLTDIYGTGFFILFFSVIFQFFSVVFIGKSEVLPSSEINAYIGWHIVFALFGYVGFTISAAYGSMYAVLASKLKRRRFDALFERLPNLEILLKLSITSFYVGFVMLTFALILGSIWLPKIFPDTSYTDPKVILTWLVWIVYAVGFVLTVTNRVYGKKFVYYMVFSLGILLITGALTSVLTNSFHSF